nr:hypothetical protein [Rickettsia argasii]
MLKNRHKRSVLLAILELLSAVPIRLGIFTKRNRITASYHIYGNIRIRTRRDSNASRR